MSVFTPCTCTFTSNTFNPVILSTAFLTLFCISNAISGILAPVTYTLGEIELWHMGVSIGLLLLVCYLLYKYGIKVYKAGILNYSSSKLWTKIFKSLKDKVA